MANSSMFVFPTMTAPWSINFCTTVALYVGIKFSSIFEAQVVRIPLVQKLSLMATGIPSRGLLGVPKFLLFQLEFHDIYNNKLLLPDLINFSASSLCFSANSLDIEI
jgi:hypothetical protein